MIITIDGPAGSGKSSVAKKLAARLNGYYLYTGLLYRAVAYILLYVLNKKLSELDKMHKKDFEFISKISYEYKFGKPQIIFEGKNLTEFLYQSSLEKPASIVGKEELVRHALLKLQQDIGKKYDIVIAEGRDCGTVIFPHADYKFFLTASLEQRARRVLLDKKRKSSALDFEKVKEELKLRDKRDRDRKVSPLSMPKEAILIDNSDISEEETIEKFLSYIDKKNREV